MKDTIAFFENKLKALYIELNEKPIEVFFTKEGEQTASVKEIIAEIKRLEYIKKDKEKANQLRRVNKGHAEKREIIKQLLSLVLPPEDIRTNDGGFHTVKLKKYASLADFMALHPSASFSYDYKDNIYTSCRIGGYSYTIYKPIYEGSTTTHERFTDLESCLSWHNILLKEMTFKEFKKLETAIFKESDRMKKEIEKSENKLKELKVYFLNNENLINRSDRRAYEYYTI